MRTFIVGALVVCVLAVSASPAIAQADAQRAADCSTYAKNRSDAESAPGRSALGGAARGAAGGALFGAIIGGGKGAGRGAAVGAGLGAIGGGVRSGYNRQASYQYYFDGCMRGQR